LDVKVVVDGGVGGEKPLGWWWPAPSPVVGGALAGRQVLRRAGIKIRHQFILQWGTGAARSQLRALGFPERSWEIAGFFDEDACRDRKRSGGIAGFVDEDASGEARDFIWDDNRQMIDGMPRRSGFSFIRPQVKVTPHKRADQLAAIRNAKMARSPHAYVRGNTARFYDWLQSSGSSVPDGPPVWICGDCHLGNLGPLADAKGRVAIQIRDLDQTVIGNPAHDLIRLGLSLASAARSSNLPGITTAKILEQLVAGYEKWVYSMRLCPLIYVPGPPERD
jgi:Uncharacterized protein conserved in bacteria (DUF2252)